jgi:hypothetical protein
MYFLSSKPSKCEVDGRPVDDYENLVDLTTDEVQEALQTSFPEKYKDMTVQKCGEAPTRAEAADAILQGYLKSLKTFPVESIEDFVSAAHIEDRIHGISSLDSEEKMSTETHFFQTQKELQSQLLAAVKSATKDSICHKVYRVALNWDRLGAGAWAWGPGRGGSLWAGRGRPLFFSNRRQRFRGFR